MKKNEIKSEVEKDWTPNELGGVNVSNSKFFEKNFKETNEILKKQQDLVNKKIIKSVPYQVDENGRIVNSSVIMTQSDNEESWEDAHKVLEQTKYFNKKLNKLYERLIVLTKKLGDDKKADPVIIAECKTILDQF